MPYNPQIHHRRSIRLKGYDYSQDGLYFITICCHKMAHFFGEIKNGEMILNEYGQVAFDEWVKLPERFPNFELDVFQIMPNHMHGIIALNNAGAGFTPAADITDAEKNTGVEGLKTGSGAYNVADLNAMAGGAEISVCNADVENNFGKDKNGVDLPAAAKIAACGDEMDNSGSGTGAGFGEDEKAGIGVSIGDSLGEELGDSIGAAIRAPARGARTTDGKEAAISDIVGAYKSLVANGCLAIFKSRNEIMGKLWQRNYYDHIIRDEHSYQRISDYIINNPANWKRDKFYQI